MKRKNIILSLVLSSCIGIITGCGGSSGKYKISAEVISNEFGYIQGGGKYDKGDLVKFKIYPNEGCNVDGMNFNGTPLSNPFFRDIRGEDYKLKYVEYSFNVDPGLLGNEGNVGTYTATFSCSVNDTSNVGAAQNASNMVTFSILLNGTNENRDYIEAQRVTHGRFAREINYIEEIEGRIEWFIDKECTTRYDFNTPVINEITLYGRANNGSDKAIVEDAMNNLLNASNIKMQINDNYATVSDYNKMEESGMKFSYYNNDQLKFILEGNNYYENLFNKYYKLDLLANDFNLTANDIANFRLFYDHLDIFADGRDYVFERAFSDGEAVKEEIVIGKNEDESDIKVNCSVYYVKNKENKLLWKIFINKGNIYRMEKIVENGENVINNVTYLDNIGSNDYQINDAYFIKIDTNNENLEDEIDALHINDVFENMLIIRPERDENLETILKDNDVIRNILKKYYYKIRMNNESGRVINDISKESITSNTVLYLDVLAQLQDIDIAINDLKENGAYYILNSGELRGQRDEVEYVVEANSNIFSLAAKPDNMDAYIWKTIEALNGVTSSDFYNFEYDTEEKVYSFYEEENDTLPFITIKLTEDNKIMEVVYVHKYIGAFGTINVTTYTSSFDYSLRDYLVALKDIEAGNWDVSYGEGDTTYSELEGINLVKKEVNDGGIDTQLWDMLHLLDDLSHKLEYDVSYEEGVYTFTNIEDNSKVYKITLSMNRILSIEVVGEVTYEFDYKCKEYLEGVQQLASGGWRVTFGEGGVYRELEGNDLVGAGATKPEGIDEDLWQLLQSLLGLVDDDNYSYTFDKTTMTYEFVDKLIPENKYTIVLEDNKISTISFGEREYIFDYTDKDYVEILEQLKQGNWKATFTDGEYREENGVDLLDSGATMPSGIDEYLWKVLQAMNDFVDEDEYESSYNQETGEYTFTNVETTLGIEITSQYKVFRNDDLTISINVTISSKVGGIDGESQEETYTFASL